jgi:hypothetical protein
MVVQTHFLAFWRALNNALAYRGEVAALHGEAWAWWRSVKFVDERLVNKVINSRKSD